MQWLLARTVTNAYASRYAVASIAAASIVGGLLLGSVCASKSTTIALAVSVICFLAAPASWLLLRPETRRGMLTTVAALDKHLQNSTAALAAPHSNDYLVYYYYGSERLKKKLVTLSDEDAAVRLAHTDNNQIALEGLSRFVPIRFEPFAAFIAQHPRIDLTTGRYDSETWVVPRLQESGYRIFLAPPSDAGITYDCEHR
jgi:hypothetical protein